MKRATRLILVGALAGSLLGTQQRALATFSDGDDAALMETSGLPTAESDATPEAAADVAQVDSQQTGSMPSASVQPDGSPTVVVVEAEPALTTSGQTLVTPPQQPVLSTSDRRDNPVTYYIQPAAAPLSTPRATSRPTANVAPANRSAVNSPTPASAPKGPTAQAAPAAVGLSAGAQTPVPSSRAGAWAAAWAQKRSSLKGSPSRVSSRVSELMATTDHLGLTAAARSAWAQLQGERVLVTVVARLGQEQLVADRVTLLGGYITARFDNRLDVYIDAAALAQLGTMDAVNSIDLPQTLVPVAFQPALTEAWGLVNASGWRAANLTGFGVKVGIIDGGFKNYTSLLGTRLPASVNTSCSQVGPLNNEPHGAAVAEIVHDIAPQAALYLAAISTEVDVGVAERCLATAGVSVINFSAGFGYDGPGNGTGFVDSIVDDATGRGMFWSNSAGNHALSHWSGTWSDPGNTGFHHFAPTDEGEAVSLSAGELLDVSLRWNDPWGASCNDYDLLLYSGQTLVADSINNQTCTQNPLEHITYVAPSSGVYEC